MAPFPYKESFSDKKVLFSSPFDSGQISNIGSKRFPGTRHGRNTSDFFLGGNFSRSPINGQRDNCPRIGCDNPRGIYGGQL